jgi:hypothetical protein
MSDFDANIYYFLSCHPNHKTPFRYYSLQVSLHLCLSTRLEEKTDKKAGRLQYGGVLQQKEPSVTDLFVLTGEKLTVTQIIKKFV